MAAEESSAPPLAGTKQQSVFDFLTTAVSSAKRKVFKRQLNEAQVELVSDRAIKVRTKWVLFIAAFIDLSGAVLLAGSFPIMCANAPGAAPMGVVPGAFPASDFEAFGQATSPPALDYAMTINLISVAVQFGGVFSNVLAGFASDKFGRKIVIQGCLIGGVFSYILMFAAGYWVRNYWFFLAANFVNGLFSGIRGVISAYLQDIHEPEEFMKEVMPTMINFFLFGAMGGSLIGMVWVAIANADPSQTNSGLALFGPCWMGVVLSTLSALMVQIYCPEPAKKEVSKADSEKKQPPPPMSRTATLVVGIILVAGSLDAFGNYGNRFARNSILTNRYPLARQSVVNYVLMASNIISIFIGQMIVKVTILKRGFMAATGAWCLLGCVASASAQFGLAVIVAYDSDLVAMGAYIAVWIFSQVFGFCSTLSAMYVFPSFIPPHKKGQMNGIRNSLTSLFNCIAPVMLSLIYQRGSMATIDRRSATDNAAVVCLVVSGSISTAAFLCFAPLPRLLPRPPPKAAEEQAVPMKEVSFEELEIPQPLAYYDSIQWPEWSSLSVRLRNKIQTARAKEGMERVQLPWSTWHEDRELAGAILQKAPGEMGQLQRYWTQMLTDDAQLEQVMQSRQKYLKDLTSDEAKKAKRAEARAHMGHWIADYLDDAGYDSWEVVPYVYKAMIMNAFPPVDTLNESMSMPTEVEDLRTRMIRFLRVLDLHVKTAETTTTSDFTEFTSAGSMGKVHIE